MKAPHGPPGLWLDLTGTQRLLGDPANIARQIDQSLLRWGVNAKIGIGHTPGAAWAGTYCRLPIGSHHPQFDHLPAISLRLPSDTLAALHHLGIHTVGQVRQLPREQLPARFGDILHTRLDQLDGVIQEPLVPIEPVWPIAVRHDFQQPVEDLQIILRVLEKLVARVAELLVRRGHGAREVLIELQRPGGAEAVAESVRFSRPTRDAKKMMSLTTCAIEKVLAAAQGQGNGGRWQSHIARAKKRFWGKRLHAPSRYSGRGLGGGQEGNDEIRNQKSESSSKSETRIRVPAHSDFGHSDLIRASGFGFRTSQTFALPLTPSLSTGRGSETWEFRAVRVSVVLSQRVTDEQISLLGGDEFAGRMELDDLVERLRVRMGQDRLIRAVVVESYLPERAWGEANDEIRNQKSESSSKSDTRICVPASSDFGHSDLTWVSGFGFRTSQTTALPLTPSLSTGMGSAPLFLHPPRELKVIVSPSHDRDGRPVSVTDPGGRVHAIVYAVGPHRVAGEWWRGHDKSRDYFDIELPDGRRWWVFRVNETGRWFWQGGYQ